MREDKTSNQSEWWKNSIIDMEPGKICFRGQAIEELMETMSFAQMMLFMVLGKKCTEEEARLFEMAMVMSVDHGPHAPSIAIARMAATCGIGINNAMASAVNVLGDNHGGAGQACAELLYSIEKRMQNGEDLEEAVEYGLKLYREIHGKIIPGFGHRFHTPEDPRSVKTIEIIERYEKQGHIQGIFKDIALKIQSKLSENRSEPIPMNVDGATAIIFCELGIPPVLCRGFFCLSRSVGILSHAWEEIENGTKNKGPIPKNIMPLYQEKEEDNDSN